MGGVHANATEGWKLRHTGQETIDGSAVPQLLAIFAIRQCGGESELRWGRLDILLEERLIDQRLLQLIIVPTSIRPSFNPRLSSNLTLRSLRAMDYADLRREY